MTYYIISLCPIKYMIRAKILFQKRIFILVLIILFGIILRSFHFFSPLTELHDFRQTHNASSVWLFYKFGFKPFDMHVPMFGGKYWLIEFPLFQTIAYLLSKIFGFYDFIGRLISIGSFVSVSLILYLLSKKILRTRDSLVIIFFYSILPLNIFFFRTYLSDPFILFLSLLTLLISSSYGNRPTFAKITTIMMLILIITLSKLTLLISLILPIFYLGRNGLLKSHHKKQEGLIILFFLFSTIISSFFWFIYSHNINLQSFTLKEDSLLGWYIGSRFLQYQFYVLILNRIINEINPIGLFMLIIGVIQFSKLIYKNEYSKIFLLWLLNVILYLLLFNNLNYIHNYYQLPIYPVFSILIIYALVSLSSFVKSRLLIIAFFIYFMASSSFPLSYYFVKDNPYQDYILDIAQVIKDCTNENEKIIYAWPDADPKHPTVLYYSRRLGYNFDLNQLTSINTILKHDPEIKSIAAYPINDNNKSKVSTILESLKIKAEEKCYKNNTLILRLISS